MNVRRSRETTWSDKETYTGVTHDPPSGIPCHAHGRTTVITADPRGPEKTGSYGKTSSGALILRSAEESFLKTSKGNSQKHPSGTGTNEENGMIAAVAVASMLQRGRGLGHVVCNLRR